MGLGKSQPARCASPGPGQGGHRLLSSPPTPEHAQPMGGWLEGGFVSAWEQGS